MANVTFSNVNDLEELCHMYTQAEREGVQWLAERRGWRGLLVKRIGRDEFNLGLLPDGEDPPWLQFVYCCLREFHAMGVRQDWFDADLDLRTKKEIFAEFRTILETARKGR